MTEQILLDEVTDLGTVLDPPATKGRHPLLHGRGLVGMVLVGLITLAAVLAPWLAPYSPTEQIEGANLLPPGRDHLLGTDELNRDIFSRLLFGVRIDLLVIAVAVPIGAAVGTLLGLVASLWSVTDVLAQRIFDVILAFPALILGIALAAVFGPGAVTIAVVIVIAEIPAFGRLTRSSVMRVRELPYVEAAHVMGARSRWVLARHVLPNSLEPLTVQLALSLSVAVFIEGAMSFLGLGISQPDPSLGSLIRDATRNIYSDPLLGVGPLAVVAVLVLGFLLVSQALAASRRS
ncbi:ABC transporter permease [Nocardioides alcanivorans]|uniref:ABC transporter permease n=1 Tax=Nocardioides alcanivorans TaxID=2897352 RepID=UPI001F45AC01|nr:ABC transporter permease [Nocardioides alcanivorans]